MPQELINEEALRKYLQTCLDNGLTYQEALEQTKQDILVCFSEAINNLGKENSNVGT